MSASSINEDNKIIDSHKQQSSDQNSTEQQSTSYDGIKTQVDIKINIIPEDSEEHFALGNSLSSLDKLAAILQTHYNPEDTDGTVFTKSCNDINLVPETPEFQRVSAKKKIDILEGKDTILKTCKNRIENSRSLDELSKGLLELECGEGTSTGIKRHTSLYMNMPYWSMNNSFGSLNGLEFLLLRDNVKIEDEASFVTVDACQKEKTTSTDVPTIFSNDTRTQNQIGARSNYMNQPPPPYEYTERVSHQTPYRQAPAYQQPQYVTVVPMPEDASRAPPYRRNPTLPHYTHVEDMFDTKAIRNQFIRKVYIILAMQLMFTFGVIALCIYEKNVRKFVIGHRTLMILSAIMFLVLMIIVFCYQAARRTFPLNFILLALLTATMAYWTAGLSCYYSTHIVMLSMGVSAGVCTLISLLACQHWFDVTNCGMALCVASVIILIYGIIAIIVFMLTGSNLMYLIYACLVTLLFCMYLMYDTQQVLGGRRIELSPEEYILGAVTLYVDVIIIFQYILILSSFCGNQ